MQKKVRAFPNYFKHSTNLHLCRYARRIRSCCLSVGGDCLQAKHLKVLHLSLRRLLPLSRLQLLQVRPLLLLVRFTSTAGRFHSEFADCDVRARVLSVCLLDSYRFHCFE